MDSATALRDVRGYAAAGRIQFTSHARRRMATRGASVEDVRHALVNARTCGVEPEQHWRVTGEDLDGDDLTAIVVLESGVIVVTMF